MGLLLSIMSLGYNTQRRNTRDVKRISDLKQIKSGMDIFFADASGYPDEVEWVPATYLNCAVNNIMLIPHDPGYPSFDYAYDGTGAGNRTGCGLNNLHATYRLSFFMEKQDRWYEMDEDGVVRDKLTQDVVSIDTLL